MRYIKKKENVVQLLFWYHVVWTFPPLVPNGSRLTWESLEQFFQDIYFHLNLQISAESWKGEKKRLPLSLVTLCKALTKIVGQEGESVQQAFIPLSHTVFFSSSFPRLGMAVF